MNTDDHKYTIILLTKKHVLFIRNTFISNARLKLAKKQAKAKATPEVEFYHLKIIYSFHPCYHPKMLRDIQKDVHEIRTSI